VQQIATTLDDYLYTSDDDVVEGEVETGRRYSEDDFNRIIEIKEREFYRVKLFMGQIDQGQKTLVFCATQEHALAVRDLINQIKRSSDPNYCVRVTANDGAEGERWLRFFQDNEKSIPTILTTSQKLSTGVDARNIRNIVLMRPINSMIEFKQIIGRGTRLFDEKEYFTIYDFVKAYEHFSDPEWDGDPEPEGGKVGEPKPCDVCGKTLCECEPEPCPVCDHSPCICNTALCPICGQTPCICNRQEKIVIKLADGKERTIQSMSATTFWSPDGKPISATQFIERLFGEIPGLFRDEEELRRLWSNPDTRSKLLAGLEERGYGREQLAEIKRLIGAEQSDLFDVLGYVAYALPTITREERVNNHKQTIFEPYGDKQQQFLSFVLDHYISQGVGELDSGKLPDLLELRYHSMRDAVSELGRVGDIRDMFVSFQADLYGAPL